MFTTECTEVKPESVNERDHWRVYSLTHVLTSCHFMVKKISLCLCVSVVNSIFFGNIQYLAGADGIIFHPVGFSDLVNFDFMRFGDGIQRIPGFNGIFYKRTGTGGDGNVGGDGIVDNFCGLLGNDIDQLVQFRQQLVAVVQQVVGRLGGVGAEAGNTVVQGRDLAGDAVPARLRPAHGGRARVALTGRGQATALTRRSSSKVR